MRLAIPIFRSRVSPVFDFSTKALIIELEQEKKISKQINLEGLTPQARVDKLKDENIDIIICAGLSLPLHRMMIFAGIQVIPGIVGEVEEVLKAYETGDLKQKRFLMPGCCHGRRRSRRHRGWPGTTDV